MAAFLRRMFRRSAVNSGDKMYRLIKIKEDGFFELDTTAVPKSLEAKGIPKTYANTVADILWKAANEMTFDFRSKISNGIFDTKSPGSDYFMAACSFLCTAELWYVYSEFAEEEKKYSHPTKDA